MIKKTDEACISRPDLARRWNCHSETLKRREAAGLLHPLFLSPRMIRYRMSEVLALENEAAAKGPEAGIPGRFVSARGPTSASASTSALTSKRRRRGVPMEKGRESKAKGEAKGVFVAIKA